METFELVGKVLEKVGTKRKDGTRIEGLWKFTIETPQGEVTVSCDETYPFEGERHPSPAFSPLNEAAATNAVVWVSGVLKDGKYRNARNAELRSGMPDHAKAAIDGIRSSEEPPPDEWNETNPRGFSEPPPDYDDPWADPPAGTTPQMPTSGVVSDSPAVTPAPVTPGGVSVLEALLALNAALLRMPEDKRTGEATPEFLRELEKTTRGALGIAQKISR